MKTMQTEIEKALTELPKLYETDGNTDANNRTAVYVFTPDAQATWIVWEYDPTTKTGFGLADLGLGFPELGYVDFAEVFAARGRFGLPVEMDRTNKTIADGYRNAGIEIPDYLL